MEPKIVLVNPPGNILVDEHLEAPLGLLSIASYLERETGIRSRIMDLTPYDLQQAENILVQEEADILGFTVYCTKWSIVQRLVRRVRERYGQDVLIVAGGPNPTAMPDITLAFEEIDIVVCGEGEKAFCQIVKEHAAGKLERANRRIIYGERLREAEFPLLDRSLVEPPEQYSRRCFGEPVVNLEASRGCHNRCFYCNSSVMGGGSRGGIVTKPPELVMQEVLESKRAGYRFFRFNDDTFTYAANRSGLLDDLAAAGIQYRIFANAKHLTEDVLQKLKRSGCFHISVGVESYNPQNLRMIGKKTSQAEIRRGINRAHDLGMIVRAYFIVGLPFDTQDSVGTYMNMVAREVAFDEYTIYPLIPYPGTVVWKEPEKFGYTILDTNFDNYIQIGRGGRTSFVLKHRNFDATDVAAWLALTHEIFARSGRIQTLASKVV